jgi:outer membrane protein insertion porin family
VDDDLLNEGNRRLRDYYQRLGYFDVKVDHEQQSTGADQVVISTSALGPRRRVESVSVAGNHYFDSATLKELLSVHAADALDRHGAYSQALVSADVSALQAVYQNNGFSKVKITPETSTPETAAPNRLPQVPGQPRAADGSAHRGLPHRRGRTTAGGHGALEGTSMWMPPSLTPLLNTTAGQLLSPQNLAGDRDALLTDYMSRGFDQVQVDVPSR